MFWKEQRQSGVWWAGAPPPCGSVPCAPPSLPPPDAATADVLIATAATMPVAQGFSADVSPKRDNQGRGSSFDDEDNY